MATQRWPRKNDPASIRARQEALGLDGDVASHDLTPWARAQESLTGVAVVPVSVVGPLVLRAQSAAHRVGRQDDEWRQNHREGDDERQERAPVVRFARLSPIDHRRQAGSSSTQSTGGT